MLGAGGKDQQIGDEGREEGNPARIAAQQALSGGDEIVHSTRGFHHRQRGNHREYHAEYHCRRASRRQAQHDHEKNQTESGNGTQRDPTSPCADYYTQQQNAEFNPKHR